MTVPPFQSMVVGQLHGHGLAVLDAEQGTPPARHAHAPLAGSAAVQRT
ncbi:MAG: hypothetical protein OYK82_01635 [Gammaproteobacteria bacterium]|nr:hypothetical protein [Gammaproteobacteria bacterium]